MPAANYPLFSRTPGQPRLLTMTEVVKIPKFFQTTLLFFLLALHLSCASTEAPGLPLTYTAIRRDLPVTVDTEGVIEAQKSHVLVTPRIGPPWPEISYLAPEGSKVNKGDVVVAFAAEKFEREHQNAVRQLAIARSEVKKTDVEQKLQRSQLESQIKSSGTVPRVRSKNPWYVGRRQELYCRYG